MSARRIALLFEYSTLNGGERSMLASIDWLQVHAPLLEFAAVAPSSGRLGDALRQRRIEIHDWSPFATAGQRHPVDQIDSTIEQIVQSIQPQLLHANSLSMGRLTGRLARRLEIPTSAHLRDIIKLSGSAISDLNANRRLIAVSQATREFHTGQGLEARRVCVVHNGIDLDQFQPRPATGYLHAELGLPFQLDHDIQPTSTAKQPRRARLIATIGQIGLRKAQHILAAAAPRIIAAIPNAHFLLVGERSSQKTESREFEQAIEQSFADTQISDRLHRLQHRDDVPRLLNEIDLLIHPANQEPYGRVLLEASSAGVPVLATSVGGTAEIIQAGVTGLLVSPQDPGALAAAAVRILSDDSLAARLRLAARERAIREFSISQSARHLEQVWSALC